MNSSQCSRNDLIDLCQPYGNLKALSLLKGYAFVQYETQTEAEMAIEILNGCTFYGHKLGNFLGLFCRLNKFRLDVNSSFLDVRLAAIGKGSAISANSATGYLTSGF